MIKIGITGQNGFIGQHLYNTIGLFPEEFERIEYKREFFEDSEKLNDFVASCDVIVHLAAKNRHNDPQVIYDENIDLVRKLVQSLELTDSQAHVLFSSSSQETLPNLYGRSKKEGREILENWALKSPNRQFTGLVVPNVFGPYGHPYFNSFIATFSHQLCNGEMPTVQVDSKVKLIFVSNLIDIILSHIREAKGPSLSYVPHTDECNVSEILDIFNHFKSSYIISNVIPLLDSKFKINLFNTFRSYIKIGNHFPVQYAKHEDERGSFVEIVRLHSGGQVSFSATLPGVTRGNHYHTRKIERFSVIKGRALIQLRKIGTNLVHEFYLDGENPSYVDMPIWYTHNIKNIGSEELYTNFWINEFYDASDPDTYFEKV